MSIGDLLKGLKIDTWYKAFIYVGGIALLLSLFIDVKEITNLQLQQIAGGVFLFGIGEWKNHKKESWIKPPNAYSGPTALITQTVWKPDIIGLCFDLIGIVLVVSGVMSIGSQDQGDPTNIPVNNTTPTVIVTSTGMPGSAVSNLVSETPQPDSTTPTLPTETPLTSSTATATHSSTIEPSPSNTATVDPLFIWPHGGEFITYQSEEYGFSFEYPSVYDMEGACGAPRERQNSVNVGVRIKIVVFDAGENSLEAWLDENGEDVFGSEFQQRGSTILAGEPALDIQYQAGFTGADAVLVKKGKFIYVVSMGWGVGVCPFEIPSIISSDPQLYEHILQTLAFTD